jgi:peptidoglycan/xylan/chitin deacetylase (PgdA/CDA1 family)
VPVHGSASPRIDRHLTRAGLVARINDDLKQLEERARDDAIGEMAARLGVSVPKSPPAEYAALSWDEAREMDRAGLEIGSHTATHPILTGLGSDRVRRELTESRERIAAELGRPVDLFCYPNGAFNDDVRREVRQAGYRCAVASDHGFNSRRSDPLALRRVSTEGDLPRFVQSTCGFEQMKVRVLYGAAALVRDAWRALMPEGA